MRMRVWRVAVLSVAAAGLLAAGSLPVAAVAAGHRAAASPMPRAAASGVTTSGNLHGFRLVYDKPNPDGSVTAVLRRADTTIIYQGGGGSQLTVSAAARVVTVTVHGKKHRVMERSLLVGATNPAAPGSGAAPAFGPGGFAATGTVAADLQRAGLPGRAAALLAAQDHAMTRGHLDRFIPDATSPGGHGHVSSWCVDTLYGASKSAVSTGCDVRTVLQQQAGNNFIADDMQAHAECTSGPCDGFLEFNIHVDYSFTQNNSVVKMVPNSQQKDGCSAGPTVSVSWFNLSFSYSEETCNGTMTPQGVGTATDVGGYWVGSCGIVTCYGDTPVDIEEIAQDHATTSTNPDTRLYLFQNWTTSFTGSGGSDGTNCPDSGC